MDIRQERKGCEEERKDEFMVTRNKWMGPRAALEMRRDLGEGSGKELQDEEERDRGMGQLALGGSSAWFVCFFIKE